MSDFFYFQSHFIHVEFHDATVGGCGVCVTLLYTFTQVFKNGKALISGSYILTGPEIK